MKNKILGDIQPKDIMRLGKNNTVNRILKRSFDIIVSFVGLIILWPIILISVLLIRINYGESGIFKQKRIGKNGAVFNIYKIKSMSSKVVYNTNVTTDSDPRITKLGRIFRKTKIDELPQLFNVLKGDMSFVGPRPDVKEMIDTIENEINLKSFLSIRPGITGPASIKYKNEEQILKDQDNPEEYNKKVIFPDKININKEYIEQYTVVKDIMYIVKTII